MKNENEKMKISMKNENNNNEIINKWKKWKWNK